MAKGFYNNIKLQKLKITYKGAFNFKNLYKYMHNWLVDEGFVDDNNFGEDMWETFYWERRSASGMTDYNIWWRTKGWPDDIGPNPWILYKLNIDFLGIAIGKTDIMHEGKKISAHNGELNIDIIPSIEFDYSKKWSGDLFISRWLDTFSRRTMRPIVKQHKDYVEDSAFRLQESIKDFLGLTTFGEYGEPFHPQKGYGWK